MVGDNITEQSKEISDGCCWYFRKFADGTEQWYLLVDIDTYKDIPHDYAIERVVGPGSRRKNWVIVDRISSSWKYPPVVAPRCKTLEETKALLLTIMHMHGVRVVEHTEEGGITI